MNLANIFRLGCSFSSDSKFQQLCKDPGGGSYLQGLPLPALQGMGNPGRGTAWYSKTRETLLHLENGCPGGTLLHRTKVLGFSPHDFY